MIYLLLLLAVGGCSIQTATMHGPVTTDSQGDHYAASRFVVVIESPDVQCEGSCLVTRAK